MLARIFSLLFILYFVVTSLVMSVLAVLIWLVTRPFDRNLRFLHLFSSFWSSLYVWGMPAWKITIEGKEKIDRSQAYMIVSNHQSMVDILAGFYLFVHFKWVAKAELFRAPFVGLVLWLNNHVKLNRTDRKSTVEMMRASQKHLESGNSVYIFPEGTRSKEVGVKPFKGGAFTMAKRTGRPILPIALDGSRDALPKHSLVIRGRHHIKVNILDPIPASIFEEHSTTEVGELIRRQIAEEIGEPLIEEGD